jgi:hypothetical protein
VSTDLIARRGVPFQTRALSRSLCKHQHQLLLFGFYLHRSLCSCRNTSISYYYSVFIYTRDERWREKKKQRTVEWQTRRQLAVARSSSTPSLCCSANGWHPTHNSVSSFAPPPPRLRSARARTRIQPSCTNQSP